MGDLERHRSKRTLGVISPDLVGADPIVSLVMTLHVAAEIGDRVAVDGLATEGLALGGPVLQGAGLEIEIERPTIATRG